MSNLSYKDLLLSFPEYLVLIKVKIIGISYNKTFKDNRKFL